MPRSPRPRSRPEAPGGGRSFLHLGSAHAEETLGVPVIDPVEDLAREADARHSRAALDRARRRDPRVAGLEEPKGAREEEAPLFTAQELRVEQDGDARPEHDALPARGLDVA